MLYKIWFNGEMISTEVSTKDKNVLYIRVVCA